MKERKKCRGGGKKGSHNPGGEKRKKREHGDQGQVELKGKLEKNYQKKACYLPPKREKGAELKEKKNLPLANVGGKKKQNIGKKGLYDGGGFPWGGKLRKYY